MNKIFIKLNLTLLLVVLFNNTVLSQCCNVSGAHDITCGESITLLGSGSGTPPPAYSDDFNAGINNALWAGPLATAINVGPNYYPSSGGGCPQIPQVQIPCTTSPPPGNFMIFTSTPVSAASPRVATTVALDVNCGGQICFDYLAPKTSAGPCFDGPESWNDGVYLQYKVGLGVWQTIQYMDPSALSATQYNTWGNYCFPIPAAAETFATQFRWYQSNSWSQGDYWAIDNVSIENICGSTSFEWFIGAVSQGTTQNLTIIPTVLTTYDLVYTDAASVQCTSSVTIDVTQPTVTPAIVPNPSNPCPSSSDLTATVAFANCSYTIDLYGGDYWESNPSIFSSLNVYINNNLFGTFTRPAGIPLNTPYTILAMHYNMIHTTHTIRSII